MQTAKHRNYNTKNIYIYVFQQLCRDWSRSSKKGSAVAGAGAASPGVHQYQQVQAAAAGGAATAQGLAQVQAQGQQQVKQVRTQDSKESNRSSTSSW